MVLIASSFEESIFIWILSHVLQDYFVFKHNFIYNLNAIWKMSKCLQPCVKMYVKMVRPSRERRKLKVMGSDMI